MVVFHTIWYKGCINTLNFIFNEQFYVRRQWHGLPCYVEEEKVSKMGTRAGRARKGGFERSREASAGVEESGKGMCSDLVVHTHICAYVDIMI